MMENFIQDCFADINETPLSDIVDRDTMIKFQLLGLKTIITRYCSPKRMFTSEECSLELQAMGINTVYAAHFDATLSSMRMNLTKEAAAKEHAVDTFSIDSDKVNIVNDIFEQNGSGSVNLEDKEEEDKKEEDDEEDKGETV